LWIGTPQQWISLKDLHDKKDILMLIASVKLVATGYTHIYGLVCGDKFSPVEKTNYCESLLCHGSYTSLASINYISKTFSFMVI